jgi:hypothetical protein
MLFQTGNLRKSLALPLRGVKSRVARESNFIGGTVPRGTLDFRTFVTPDSDPIGANLVLRFVNTVADVGLPPRFRLPSDRSH